MYTPFAPMNGATVRFAKDYRAARSRTAERSRLAAMFQRSRRSVRARSRGL
ncbi:MAG: hypothetical protein ABWX84_09130 [Nocardioides sp.]